MNAGAKGVSEQNKLIPCSYNNIMEMVKSGWNSLVLIILIGY